MCINTTPGSLSSTMAVKLHTFILFECQTGMFKFVLVFRSSLWLGPLNSQVLSCTRISIPRKMFDDLFNLQDLAFLWRARCSCCSCSRNSACLTHSCQASPAISIRVLCHTWQWTTVSLGLDLNSFCRPTSIQESKINSCFNKMPLVTSVHARSSSLCHQFFEASYVPRTLIAPGSSQRAFLCPLFVSTLASAPSCEKLVLRVFAALRTRDLLPLGDAFCCLILPSSDF